MNAEFITPEILWLLPIAITLTAACYFVKRASFLVLALRILSLSLLIFALAEPVKKNITTSSKAVALFDVSKSITEEAKKEMATKLIEYSKQADIETYAFADTLSENFTLLNSKNSLSEVIKRIEELGQKLNKSKSNIRQSLELASQRTNSGSILLFSDGNESKNSDTNSKGYSIYPIAVESSLFLEHALSFSDFKTPIAIKSGDKAKLDIVVRNNSQNNINQTLLVEVDGKVIKTKKIEIAANSQKKISLKTDEIKGGKHKVSAKLLESNKEINSWITAHEKSKTLLLNGDLEDERVLSSLIRLKGYKLESIIAGDKPLPEELSSYSTIIFNNIAKAQLPNGFLEKVKSFTKQGGGLMLLGGNRSYGLGGYIGTELEEISPLKFKPPQTEKRRLINAIALVMDKSGSMAEQDKITSAKKAALSSIESLKDEDYISVIGFDFAPFVIIDLQKVGIVKQTAESRLRNLTAVGKTNLLPALAAARQKLNNCPASRKHIIVLSDGKFPLESDLYVDEINKLREGGITVSAIALGIEADVPFMKILARYGKGAFYQTIDASALPEIFVEDIKVSTENALNEQMNFSVAIGPSGLINTSVEKYRPLRGFVETLPKNGSALELITKSKGQAFPILASWKYAKGNVIAFTSDANGRWSGPWLSWEKFSFFWGELLEKLQPKESQKDIDFDLRYKIQGDRLKLDLAIFGQDSIISGILNNNKQDINFAQIAKGKYQAELELNQAGDYFFDLKVGETKLPEIGINVDSLGESAGAGINLEYLLNLSKDSNGEVNPEKIIAKKLVKNQNKNLHLPLLILGFLLLLLEAFIRESRTQKN